MSGRGDDPEEDWPEPLTHPWGRPEADVGTAGELHHVWLIEVTDKDLDRDEARACERAWERTGWGFQP